MDNRKRRSTVIRDNEVHKVYNKVMQDIGPLRTVISKSYVYDLVRKKTHLSIRTISYIINHTKLIEDQDVEIV